MVESEAERVESQPRRGVICEEGDADVRDACEAEARLEEDGDVQLVWRTRANNGREDDDGLCMDMIHARK